MRGVLLDAAGLVYTAPPMSQLNAHLKAVVDDCVAELPEVTARRMFGSDAWFANTNIFALVWDGRVALKLRDAARYAQALAMDGAAPWNPMGPGRKGMTHWVLVSEALHDDLEELARWAALAHRDNFAAKQTPPALPKPAARGPKRPAAPKPAAKAKGKGKAAPKTKAKPAARSGR